MQPPAVAAFPDELAALLAILPADTSQISFVNIETVMLRPAFKEDLEYSLEDFIRSNEKAPSEELLRSAGVSALVLGYDREYEWSCILRGDSAMIQKALSQAAMEPGVSPSTKLVEIHRNVEIFGVFVDRTHAPVDELYLVIPDRQILILSKGLGRAREMVDRRLDGVGLPEPLAMMLRDWGRADYLEIFEMENNRGDAPSRPIDVSEFLVIHATLEEDATTRLRVLQQFGDETQAALAAAWLQEQTEPHWRNIGYGAGVQVEQWLQKGSTVYAEVAVPDEEVLGLIMSN